MKLFKHFKKFRLKLYKKKKVKKSRTKEERNYKLNFDIIIQDKNDNLKYDNVEIEIPARSLFDAKNKLKDHLKRKLSFDLRWVEVLDDDEEEI